METFQLNHVSSQQGRIAIVTGANVGLGFETAVGLAQKQVKVILACRNMEKAAKAKEQIIKGVPGADLEIILLDLNALQSVREFASEFKKRYDRLDLLINNAGIMVPPYQKTEEGFESQFGVNYLGHFLLTNLLMPLLLGTKNSRVVTLSSIAHKRAKINFEDLNSRKSYSRWKAYGQSKLACLLFAYELQRRLDKAGHADPVSVAAHPGVSDTELSRNLPSLMKLLMPLFAPFMTQSPWQGAQPTLYAALGEDIRGGDYCGPDGRREWKGNATKVGSTRLSHDEAVASRLWEASEKLTGEVFTIASVNETTEK